MAPAEIPLLIRIPPDPRAAVLFKKCTMQLEVFLQRLKLQSYRFNAHFF
jgi:hypothetical protein